MFFFLVAYHEGDSCAHRKCELLLSKDSLDIFIEILGLGSEVSFLSEVLLGFTKFELSLADFIFILGDFCSEMPI